MRSEHKSNDTGWARLTALGLTVAGGVWAGAMRVLPHWPNFTPVGALGLFAGARLRLWQAFALLLLTMTVSDLLLWQVSGLKPFNPWVYGSFLFDVVLGRLLLKKGGLWRVPLVSLIASLQFFFVTNFGVWAGSDGSLYPKTLTGLGECYLAGLPFTGKWGTDGTQFFFGGLAGDLVCSILFFGLYAVILAVLERRKASQVV